jgi:DNA-binding MarR family transcriptional regulator
MATKTRASPSKLKAVAIAGESANVLATRRWREAVPDDRIGHLVKDLNRAVSRGMQMRLMEHSVSFGFWGIFRVLWETDELTQRELSELVGLSEPTTYSALQTMERLGYVTRQKQPGNLRKIYVSLTPVGKALKEKLIPLAEELNAVAIHGIPARDLAIFRKTILAMQKNLDDDEATLNRTLPPLRRMV